MKILLSGANGFIGSALVPFLEAHHHEVVQLVRKPTSPNQIPWTPESDRLNLASLTDVDAVVHLAAHNVASRRWTAAQKTQIQNSRLAGTTLLARAIQHLHPVPAAFLSASAVGYYGDRADQLLDESALPGSGFLADVCQQWEQAASFLSGQGIRVAFLRFGLVLSPTGGALARMLLPFKLGLGGVIGSGQQYWSWISLLDSLRAILFILNNPILAGPVNVVTPQPVTNQQFTQTLGQALRRPAFLPMPAALARLVFGEMANELLLASARVKPAKLLQQNFDFLHPTLTEVLKNPFLRAAPRKPKHHG